jgi:hypothetical protein
MAWAGGSRDSSISEAGQQPHPLLLTEAKQRHDPAGGETQGVSGFCCLPGGPWPGRPGSRRAVTRAGDYGDADVAIGGARESAW